MKLFVRDFPAVFVERDLRDIFEFYGTVESVAIVRDRKTKASKRYGFIVMPDDAEALNAIEESARYDWCENGERCVVEVARNQAPEGVKRKRRNRK